MKDTALKRQFELVIMRASRALRNASPARLSMAAAYVVSALITAFVIWMIIATPGTGPIGPASRVLFLLVCLNLFLLIGLCFFVVRRIFQIAQSRGADAGARLHLRFVTLFALAAVTPAFVVALFFGVLVNRGVETWFSERVQSSVENGAKIAELFVDEQQKIALDTVEDIAVSIDHEEGRALFPDRLAFAMALQDLAASRGGLAAIYVIDRTGQVLARAESEDAPVYLAPPRETISDVAAGEARVALFSGPDAVRVVYPLTLYDGAQLYGVRLLQPGMMTRLSSVSRAVVDLREAAENSNRVQGVFALAYIETVLLVLVGAVWVGVSAADSIAVPVARLVQAADKVAAGNLDARVITTHQSEDIAVLSRAFNRMTSDLQSQQLALKSAGEEAEARRRFIETVLSEISAGIVGIDVMEHVSAINRHAANFISVVGEDTIGLKIRELVPEISALLDKVSVSKVEEQEVDLVRKGETRRLRVRISGLETGGAVITFDDITRLVAAQRNAAWKDVAQRIAHEIKNPLTPIQLSAERIKRKYRDHIDADLDVFDRLTDTIIRQVGDIGRMVDEFSAFARMPVPNFAEEDAGELVRHAVFARRVADPDIQIDITEPMPDIKVVCDGRLLAQALGNVLKNGGEAISSRQAADRKLAEQSDLLPPEPFKGRLRVDMALIDNHVRIDIEDNGIGLPDKDRDRLTEPYVTTRDKGTGLGLAIVKRILEDHGGEFTLSDAVHLSGARATLRLPYTQIAADESGSMSGHDSTNKMVRL